MILVDSILDYPSGKWCHMASDLPGEEGLIELHAMAYRVGLARRHFQGHDPRHPHYDLRPHRRGLAIRQGAEAVSNLELYRRCFKETGRDKPRIANPGDLPAL